MFIMVLKNLLVWDWEQSSLVLNTPTKKARDSFASSMIKEDNRVGSHTEEIFTRRVTVDQAEGLCHRIT